MKVRKLIEQLEKQDPEADAYVSSNGIDYEIAEEVGEDDGDVVILGKVKRDF